jgi:hypothetical protein
LLDILDEPMRLMPLQVDLMSAMVAEVAGLVVSTLLLVAVVPLAVV